MINATKIGLQNFLNTGFNNFKTAIGGRLYFVEAEKFEGYPYAVIADVAPAISRDTGSRFETERFQITIFDVGGNSVNIGAIQQYLWDILDDAEKSLTIQGNSVIECTREAPSGYQFRVEKVWHSVTQYRILLQH